MANESGDNADKEIRDVMAEERSRGSRRWLDTDAQAQQVKREREQAEDEALLRQAIETRDKEKVLTALRVLGLPLALLHEVETLWRSLPAKKSKKKGRS